jgi:uncharacterized membrane protein
VTVWRWYRWNVIVLILLCLIPVWIRTALHQYHNYDLGIFAQALHGIRLDTLNPFIPALNIELFRDHFDPILILASPLGKILEPAYAVLLVEHLLILLAPLMVVLACHRDRESTPFLCFAISYLLFNRGIMSALGFPVHPTTWAAFFVVAIGVVTANRHWVLLGLAAILLMACKEEFPFPVLVLGICLAVQKHFKIGFTLIVLGAVWLVVAFGLRPLLLEDTHRYASRVLSPLMEAPISAIWARLRSIGDAKRLFQCLLPLLPAAFWLFRQKATPNWPMLLSVVPLLAIRFLDGAWKFHYLAPVAPFLLLATWKPDLDKLPWRHAALGIAITVLGSASPIQDHIRVYADIGRLFGERRAVIEEARTYLLDNPVGRAVVGGNLTPLLASRGQVFQIGGAQPEQPYRFLLTEKPPNGDPWPWSHSDIDRIINEWRINPETTVLRDDSHIFFAESATWKPRHAEPEN